MDTFIIILFIVAFICIAFMAGRFIKIIDVLQEYNKIQDLQIDMFREINKSQDRINNYFCERLTALELQLESFKNKDESNEPEDK